ncbi:thiol reductant ABC exporter subunit CydC [Actinomyces slackii]|nr:thiol reductant ABC exporter subunit CydC [Actinomyces slackii]
MEPLDSLPQDRHPSRGELWRWLLGVTRPALTALAGSTACRVVEQLAGIAMLALGAHAVASTALALAQGRAPGAIWPVLATMAALAVIKAALRYGEQFLGHMVAFKALELLREQIFTALIPRSPQVSLTMRSGDLLTRSTKDVDRIEVFFAHTIAPLACAVVLPTVVLSAIGTTVSWAVAGAAAAVLATGLIIVPLLGRAAGLAASRAAARQRARLSQHVTDTVQGMSEVVGFGRSQERVEEMGRIDAALGGAVRPAVTWAAVRRGTNHLVCLAAPIAVVALGAGHVAEGAIELPVLAAAAAAVLRLGDTVRGIEDLASAMATAQASAERVWQVVTAPTQAPEGTKDLTTGISHEILWQDVSYTYPGATRPALESVSLRAKAGQWTCLVGASGSGKTTLAQLVARFDAPTSGRIVIDGVDLGDLRSHSLYREIGLVPQHPHLFRATVAENLRLAAPSASHAELERACRAAGIHEEIEALPQGYDTLVGERGESLSGGQRQRLALARVLLARPTTLLLDEFSAHLDPQTDAAVRASVRDYLEGATIIEITHRVQWLDQADHVVVLDGGQVVQSGRPADLLEADGPLRALAARD